MAKANLGCGRDLLLGWDNVDHGLGYKQSDNVINTDVLMYLSHLPFGYLDEVKAHHILEHLPDLDYVMYELSRTCKSGAKIDIVVPLANTLWAVADPTHKTLFNHRTFEYYCTGFDTSYGRDRLFKLVSRHIERSPDEWFEGIQWIVANLHVILERI